MARGKPWTGEEIALLQKMIEQGMSLDDIVKSGKFPHRTPRAIEKQIKILSGSLVSQKKISKVTLISKAEIPDFDEIIARYVDAFNKLCDKTEFTKEELERFRIIFMAAWKYRDMFREYEEIEEVKHDVERLKGMVAQLLAEKKKETQGRNKANRPASETTIKREV